MRVSKLTLLLFLPALTLLLAGALQRHRLDAASSGPGVAPAPQPGAARAKKPLPLPILVPQEARTPDSPTREAAREMADLSPQSQAQVRRIMEDLDAQLMRLMEAALREWRVDGGNRSGWMPDFECENTPYGRKIAALRRAADQKIMALLSEAERARWQATQAPKAERPLVAPMLAAPTT